MNPTIINPGHPYPACDCDFPMLKMHAWTEDGQKIGVVIDLPTGNLGMDWYTTVTSEFKDLATAIAADTAPHSIRHDQRKSRS